MTDFLDLPDLACESVGGAALACNDELFAEKENLLREHAAVWKDHVYTAPRTFKRRFGGGGRSPADER